jgi:branched-chain amino acid transport system substrate-binding protein
MFPAVDQSFVAGLRGALTDAGVAFELAIEPTGNCAVKDIVTEKIQRLLLQHTPDVVTGVMGAGLSLHMHALFRDAETPFVVTDLGADPIMTGESRNPFVFVNTLNLWQSACALGYWAASAVGSKACVATGFHEAGYGIIPAFWQGFHEAGGGTILSTEVTHRASADDDPSEHLRRIAALDPDFVMAFYSGREGISFVNAWHDMGLSARVPLIASPLLTHDAWLARMPHPPVGVRTASSWDTGADGDEPERFRCLAKVGEGKSPAVFALLGYETGRMLAAATARGGNNLSGETMCRALSGVSFVSPRGKMMVDEATGEVGTTDYLQELQRGTDGTLSRVTLETLPLPPSFRTVYDAIRQSDGRSGWINPYLVN